MVEDKKFLIERKSIGDAIHSFHQKRLDEQILHVDALLVENNWYTLKRYRHQTENIMKHLNRISLALPVLRTESVSDTIWTLCKLEEMLRNNEIGELRKPVIKSDLPDGMAKEALVLMGFPGIGAERANRLLHAFGSIEECIKNIDQWYLIEGISDITTTRASDFYRRKVA
jgi:ERCC4-type nuclease